MGEINTTRIKDKFYSRLREEKLMKSTKKRRWPALIAAVAAVSLMSAGVLAAYTNVIDFSAIHQRFFGADIEQYVHMFDAENEPQAVIESEYDGIVMRLVSAVNDEATLRIFATLTDTTDDRLGGHLNFMRWGLSKGHTQGISVLDYDAETRTATIMIQSIGGDHYGEATLTINSISEYVEGNWSFSFTIPEPIVTEFSVNRLIQIGGLEAVADTVSLSPLGVTVRLRLHASMVEGLVRATETDTAIVEYANGTTVEFTRSSIHGNEGETAVIFGRHGEIIDVGNVVSVTINGERIEIAQ